MPPRQGIQSISEIIFTIQGNEFKTKADMALKLTMTDAEDVTSASSVSEQKKQTTTKSSGKKKKKKKSKKEKKEAKERKKRVAHHKNMIEWREFRREFLNSVDNCQYRWDVSSNLSLVKKNGTFSRQTKKNGNVITKILHRRIKEMRETLRAKLSIDQKKKLAVLKAVVQKRRQWLCKPNEAIKKKSYLCVDIDTILNEIESDVFARTDTLLDQ